ncbi:F-box domain-containing protein [Dioscorea alata]|uniref:F-box domain-containing protein n=1 Tax=Dioscorea alata TaxID=55571 RepID=A0ACB7WFN5_DIOAL|nr:F-box domain-containing protein [Dioscorea alata]
MDGDRAEPTSNTAVGLCLLPSELIHEILLRLSIPDLLLLRAVSRTLSSLLASSDFRRLYSPASSGPCLFVLTKRFPRDALLRVFHPASSRWLRLPSALLPSSTDPYLLAASGDHLLFASNSRRELLALNLSSRSISTLPHPPLGPRRTSSWRRSGLKLISDGSHFRFLFAEIVGERPFLYEYGSATGTWRSSEAVTNLQPVRGGVWLNLVQFGNESVILRAGPSDEDYPIVLRPRLSAALIPRQVEEPLRVYGGDGKMVVVRSTAVGVGMRVVTAVEVWAVTAAAGGGVEWEMVTAAPEEVVEKIRRPFGVMMGCMEEENESTGVIMRLRIVLVSNLEGSWDITWLGRDAAGSWVWVPVPAPESGSTGFFNMAGIVLSSSFSGLSLLL